MGRDYCEAFDRERKKKKGGENGSREKGRRFKEDDDVTSREENRGHMRKSARVCIMRVM